MKHLQKKRRLEERRARELRKLHKMVQRIAREEKENPKDILYDLTGEWEPVKTHEWDEF